MPGNVQSAILDAVDVFPPALASRFTETREFPPFSASYNDGTIEHGKRASTSRRTFTQTLPFSDDEWDIVKEFLEDHWGSPFLFFNSKEPVPGQPIGSNHDEFANETSGRYVVAWRGGWNLRIAMARIHLQQIVFVEQS